MKKMRALLLSSLLVFQCGAAFATTPKTLPRHITLGLLKAFCKDDGKSGERAKVFGAAYCEGYINGFIDSYFGQLSVKRASLKRNACVLFPSNDWLFEEIRADVLAISAQGDLDLFHGLPAEPWIRARIVAKCESKK